MTWFARGGMGYTSASWMTFSKQLGNIFSENRQSPAAPQLTPKLSFRVRLHPTITALHIRVLNSLFQLRVITVYYGSVK